MQKGNVLNGILGIFLFVMIFVSGCGGGFAMSPTGEKQNTYATGNLAIEIIPLDCSVNIVGNDYQEYNIYVSDGFLKRTLPVGKYMLEFFCEQYEKRVSYIEIKPSNSVNFVVDFTQPQDDN